LHNLRIRISNYYSEDATLSQQDQEALYSIGAVARMIEVPTPTLRAWEERYGVVKPERSHGSQRLYSRSQVEHLRFIKAQIDAGASAADAHRLLAQELQTGRLPVIASYRHARPGPLIMIAERDSYAADLADYFLRTEGYDVCMALDARQAKLLFEERSPDLRIQPEAWDAGPGCGLDRWRRRGAAGGRIGFPAQAARIPDPRVDGP